MKLPNVTQILRLSLLFSAILSINAAANENLDNNALSNAQDSALSASDNNEQEQKVRLEKSVAKTQVSMGNVANELQPKSISVIPKERLLDSSQGNIQTVLESVPGILYSRSGGINGQVTIRGQNSNNSRSVIMIDGVRFNGRNTLDVNTLNPYAFESIEVLRGAGSSLWGSDAMNGVINFRSRRSNFNLSSETFDYTARIRALEYGSVNNLYGGRLEILGGGGGWDMLIGLNGKEAMDYTTPIKENGSNKAKNSRFNSFGVDFNIGYTTKSNSRYYLQGRYTRVESHRAGGLGAAPGVSYGIVMSEIPISEYYLRIGIEKRELSFADSMEAYLYWRHWDTDIWNNRSQQTFGTSRVNIHQKVYDNNYFGGRLVFNGQYGRHNLTYGAEVESNVNPTQVRQIQLHNNNVTNTTNRPSSNTDFAIFVNDNFKAFDSWYLNGSLRADYILTTISKKRSSTEINQINGTDSVAAAIARDAAEKFDKKGVMHSGAITGAIGSVWFLNDYLSNVITISHNFKSAGASARMSTTPSGSSTLTAANPDIKNEYSQTGEFGFRFQSDNHFVSLIAFYTNYMDMLALSSYQNASIDVSSSSTSDGRLYRYENIGKAYITGLELEGNHSFFDDLITLRYVGAYNYGYNTTDRKPIAYLAPLYGQITLRFNFRPVFFSITERGYGNKFRIDASEERRNPGYVMTDIMLGVNLGYFTRALEDMQILIGANNLFNQVGRNPVTVENVSQARALSNPLVEPGRNIFVKYVWNY